MFSTNMLIGVIRIMIILKQQASTAGWTHIDKLTFL